MTSHGHLAPGAVPGLFALALALASGAPPASAQAVQWRPDYGAARREAATHERPLVLVFSAESCPWCRRMGRTTLRDPEVVGVLNRRFVPVKVAADDARNGSLVSGLGLQGLPAVVLVAPGGQVLAIREGYLDAAGFLALLDRAPALGTGPGRGPSLPGAPARPPTVPPGDAPAARGGGVAGPRISASRARAMRATEPPAATSRSSSASSPSSPSPAGVVGPLPGSGDDSRRFSSSPS